MPPIYTYTFKHKLFSCINTIELKLHSNEQSAWNLLSNIVLNIKDWDLI